jgi:hypothetical protein
MDRNLLGDAQPSSAVLAASAVIRLGQCLSDVTQHG